MVKENSTIREYVKFLVFAFAITASSTVMFSSLVSASGGDWTSFTLNNNDTRFQTNSSINASNVGHLVSTWNFTTGNSVTSTPIVYQGNVFFADWGGFVYSVNILSGTQNWKENLGGGISSTLLMYNGTLYGALGPDGTADIGSSVTDLAGNKSTAVFALNPTTGAVEWLDDLNRTTNMDAIWGSPLIYNNILYIGVSSQGDESQASWKGALYGIYANNGTMAWNNTSTPNTIGYGSVILGGVNGGAGVTGSVAIDPLMNSVYFGTGNLYGIVNVSNETYGDSILSLNATNGRINWYRQIYNLTHGTNNTPDTYNGMLFCANDTDGHSTTMNTTNFNVPVCVNSADNVSNQAPQWTDYDFISTPNLFSYTNSITHTTYSALGLGMKDGNYYILNRDNGQVLEVTQIGTPETNLGNQDGGILGVAATTNTTNPEIFIPSYWNQGSGNYCGPTACGVVEAYYPSNGTVAWRFNTTGIVDGSVTAVNGTVFFEDEAGLVYAVSSSTGKLLWSHAIPAAGSSGVTVGENHVLATGFFGALNSSLGVYAFALPTTCSGTPQISITPDPSSPNGTVIANISGLFDCAGSNITIRSYAGCTPANTTDSLVASFISGATGGNVMFTAPGGPGSYGYYGCVNETTGIEATSLATLTVVTNSSNSLTFGTPQVILQNSTLHEGENESIFANLTGGTLPYTDFVWTVNGITLSTDNQTLIFFGNSTTFGNDIISVTVTDSASNTATGNAIIDVIGPRLTVNITPNIITTSQGSNVSFNANATGGTPPYVYNWTFMTGNTIGTLPCNSLACTFNAVSSGTVNVLVTDNTSNTAFATALLTVGTTPPTSGGSGSGGGGGGGGGGFGSGGGGGGLFLPSVSFGNSCATITNISAHGTTVFKLDGVNFSIVDNFVQPNLTGVTINSNTLTLVEGAAPTSLGVINGYTFTASLINVSYIPRLHTVALKVCGAAQTPLTNPVLTTNSSNVTLGPLKVSIPASENGSVGTALSITAVVTGGDGRYSFLWYNNTTGSPLPMASQSSNTLRLTLGNVTGNFTYFVVVGDEGANTSAKSNQVILTIKPSSSSNVTVSAPSSQNAAGAIPLSVIGAIIAIAAAGILVGALRLRGNSGKGKRKPEGWKMRDTK